MDQLLIVSQCEKLGENEKKNLVYFFEINQ